MMTVGPLIEVWHSCECDVTSDRPEKHTKVDTILMFSCIFFPIDGVNTDTNVTSEPAKENDYSELFSSSLKNSFESTEISEHLPVIHSSRAPMSPVHFGLAQAGLLSEHLSKKQLPCLTRIEQLELQALADTLATTKNDLEESTSEIDRGLKFARKYDIGKSD